MACLTELDRLANLMMLNKEGQVKVVSVLLSELRILQRIREEMLQVQPPGASATERGDDSGAELGHEEVTECERRWKEDLMINRLVWEQAHTGIGTIVVAAAAAAAVVVVSFPLP